MNTTTNSSNNNNNNNNIYTPTNNQQIMAKAAHISRQNYSQNTKTVQMQYNNPSANNNVNATNNKNNNNTQHSIVSPKQLQQNNNNYYYQQNQTPYYQQQQQHHYQQNYNRNKNQMNNFNNNKNKLTTNNYNYYRNNNYNKKMNTKQQHDSRYGKQQQHVLECYDFVAGLTLNGFENEIKKLNSDLCKINISPKKNNELIVFDETFKDKEIASLDSNYYILLTFNNHEQFNQIYGLFNLKDTNQHLKELYKELDAVITENKMRCLFKLRYFDNNNLTDDAKTTDLDHTQSNEDAVTAAVD